MLVVGGLVPKGHSAIYAKFHALRHTRVSIQTDFIRVSTRWAFSSRCTLCFRNPKLFFTSCRAPSRFGMDPSSQGTGWYTISHHQIVSTGPKKPAESVILKRAR